MQEPRERWRASSDGGVEAMLDTVGIDDSGGSVSVRRGSRTCLREAEMLSTI
jgi:hypothetical protein